ncbi:carcinine transporter-like isoform X2 [Stegodyphus dumicola]|uniref:carcinine transporter-like isoform X2 n=1 Tax=Stegodyphus dumicola TaxID=202533 RepID=UPI0015AC15B0|nr:carcinine transporter-like isoform X2 [Stegodyphus dumicola]
MELTMDFENILKEVGSFGSFQKILLMGILVPALIVSPWFSMDAIFLSNTPDHWCYVPEMEHSNLSLQFQKMLIRPSSDKSCSRYDVNYSQILQSGNWSVNPDWPTTECDHGWQFDKTNYDATATTKWNMVCKDSQYNSLMLSLVFIGDLVGTPVYGFLSDRCGRKPTFFFVAFLVSVTEVGSVLSPYFSLFLVLRVINGTAMTTIYAGIYIITLELVDPSMRARINGIATTSWTGGLCLLSLIAWVTRNWIYLSIVVSVTAASLLLLWKVIPESPSWLISQEKYAEATEVMKKISKINGKSAHEGNELFQKIQEFGEKIQKQKLGEDKHSPLDFFRYPTLRKRFILVTLCWMGDSIPYYGLQINVKNLAGNEFLNFFLVSLIEVPAHICTWLFMERIGRRCCSVCAFALSSLACLLPVVFISEYEIVGVVASLIAKASTSGAFLALYQQGPELFPTPLRAVGMGMSCTIGVGSALIVPYIVYLAKYGTYIPFLIFAMISMASGVCASFLPETLNKNLPQTVADAENFEKDFKFFSCSASCEPEPEAERSTWTPARLSVR